MLCLLLCLYVFDVESETNLFNGGTLFRSFKLFLLLRRKMMMFCSEKMMPTKFELMLIKGCLIVSMSLRSSILSVRIRRRIS